MVVLNLGFNRDWIFGAIYYIRSIFVLRGLALGFLILGCLVPGDISPSELGSRLSFDGTRNNYGLKGWHFTIFF